MTADRLPRLVNDWLNDCRIRQHSPRTIELRQVLFGRLRWFLDHRSHSECGKVELRDFFAYLSTGHQGSQGRWLDSRYTKPLRPETVATYFNHIRAFFSWLVNEEFIEVSPMAKFAPPVVRADQVQPFTREQVESLIHAARKSRHAHRDEAIVRFLVDTGVRASELCSLKMSDVDIVEGQAYVIGKGNKRRMICFGRKTANVLRKYLRDEPRLPTEPLFISERGSNAGAQLTRSGLKQLIERLGLAAKLQSVRCSPHTFRHTFAVEFLNNGGNVFSLKQLLGHTSLQVTNRYVALAQADIRHQHHNFSPGDRLFT